jgi:hypothetical protein
MVILEMPSISTNSISRTFGCDLLFLKMITTIEWYCYWPKRSFAAQAHSELGAIAISAACVVQAVDFDCLSYPWHANSNPQECSRWPDTKTNTKA